MAATGFPGWRDRVDGGCEYQHVRNRVTSHSVAIGLVTERGRGIATLCNHSFMLQGADFVSPALAQMPHMMTDPIQPVLPAEFALVETLGRRSIVLVGMMGAGKSSVGRKLGLRLALPFVDADAEIEAAAGMTIPDIFQIRGEADFRAGEARVIARLLEGGPQVLATGGGAYMNPNTRSLIAQKGISVWLRAEFDVLMRRIKRRNDRPLLHTPDPDATLQALIEQRYPVYALADVTIDSRDVLHDVIVDELIVALLDYLKTAAPGCGAPICGTSS